MSEPANTTSAEAAEPRVLKLRSPEDLVETLPYLVGFQPSRSIVLVCLRRRELLLTMRLDLPPSRHAQASARTLTGPAVRSGTDMVLVACYPEGDADRAAAERMVGHVRRELRGHDVTVKEAIRVEDGRWWSYLCDRPECCPPDGTPVPDSPGPAAVAAVLAGEVALPSRRALYDRLAPVNDIAAIAVAQSVAAAEAGACARIVADKEPDPWRLEEGRFLAGLLERYAAGGRASPAEAGRALVALQDIQVRDACIAWWDDKACCATSVKLWTDLVRHAPPDLVAAAATLLAGSAWLSGEGALANIALERAFAGDSSYRLARILETAIQGGISPERFRGIGRFSGSAQPAGAD